MPLATRWIAPALAIAALSVAASPGNAAAGPRWAKPVLVSASQADRETSLALDPTNRRLQLICAPAGVPAIESGHSYFHLTADGGKSWHAEDVENTPTDTRRASFEGGDCDVAFDQAGTMYSADVSSTGLSIGHSTDHGRTWNGTAVSTTSPNVDRPWLVGGPKGTVYLSYADLQCCEPAVLLFQKSTDFGQTFTPAVPITIGNLDGPLIWEGNFVTGASGQDLYLVYSHRSSLGVTIFGSNPTANSETIWVTASHDGGQTWTPHLIAKLPMETSSIYPSIGMDAGGTLHVVWSAPAQVGNPVSYTASTDHGLTWRTPVALNPGKVGVAPWVVGGKAGQAAVAWLGSPDPKATATASAPYYFSWAKIQLAGSRAAISTGNTTKEPIFTGKQEVPEFETLRLDDKGKMHLGMSVFKGRDTWAIYSQNEL